MRAAVAKQCCNLQMRYFVCLFIYASNPLNLACVSTGGGARQLFAVTLVFFNYKDVFAIINLQILRYLFNDWTTAVVLFICRKEMNLMVEAMF